MKLSENFTLSELTVTNTGLPNVPNSEETKRLFYLATFILQPIRSRWGPVVVNSGFRSEAVNKAVGGVEDSQHRLGEACDFKPLKVTIREVFMWIVLQSGLRYGQAIYEVDDDKIWIHVSLPRLGKEQQALTYKNGVYAPFAGVI